MPVRSLSSSILKWPDEEKAISALRRWAEWDTTDLPVLVDLPVYTEKEWRSLVRQGRFAATVLKEVVWVFMVSEENTT